MVTLNTDEWILLTAVLTVGMVIGAVIVEIVVSFRLNANERQIADDRREIEHLNRCIRNFSGFDRDGNGKLGGSLPR